MNIEQAGNTYAITFAYNPQLVAAVKEIPGRRWDAKQKCWTVPTSSAPYLEAFCRRAGIEVPAFICAQKEKAEESKQASRAADAAIAIPCPEGLQYLPYQRAGIAYAAARRHVLIGDEMGLGKTIQAIGVANSDESVRRVLIVCPASLKINWAREWHKWDVKALTCGIANGGDLPIADVVIVNYDIIRKHRDALMAREWDLVILDEAHYLKNPKAQRTALVLGGTLSEPNPQDKRRKIERKVAPIPARRLVALTGTPIGNRPAELWTLVHALDPSGLGASWKSYMCRYAAAHQGSFGWDVSGASHLDELQDRLRSSCMVRRLKAEVLAELPEKRRCILELPADACANDAVATEQRAWASQQEHLAALSAAVELAKAESDIEYNAAVVALRAGTQASFAEMSKLRHATALAKLPLVIAHLRDCVEQGKVVCFAHHRDVISALANEFGLSCCTITGDTSMEARQEAVDRFQSDPTCRLFIGNIQAAGVGLTLTASSHVVFAELDWVPGNVSQAEDRCHRIGQRDSVLVQHLVLSGSLDAKMAQTLIAKQAVIDAALDKEHQERALEPIVVADESATKSVSREKVREEAGCITSEQITAVHTALRILSARCDGAQSLDGSGFNKLDAMIGHSLAACTQLTPAQAVLGRQIARKYKRQYSAELLEQMGRTKCQTTT